MDSDTEKNWNIFSLEEILSVSYKMAKNDTEQAIDLHEYMMKDSCN